MHKTMTAAVAITVTYLSGAAGAFAGQQDFTFHNNSDSTVTEMYVSPTWSDSWGLNVLGEPVWPSETTDITFNGYDECFWDVKVVNEYFEVREYDYVNLCSLAHVRYPYSEASW